jgi:hypothetical protein
MKEATKQGLIGIFSLLTSLILISAIFFIINLKNNWIFFLMFIGLSFLIYSLVDYILFGKRSTKDFYDIMGLDEYGEGDYRNYHVRFGEASDEHPGRSETYNDYTQLVVTLENPVEIEIEIYPETITRKVKKELIRQPEIKIGHSIFDKRFIIQGSSESDIKSILDSPIYNEILSVDRIGFKRIRLEKNKIIYDADTILDDKLQLKSILDVVSDIAEMVDGKEFSTEIAKEFDEQLEYNL